MSAIVLSVTIAVSAQVPDSTVTPKEQTPDSTVLPGERPPDSAAAHGDQAPDSTDAESLQRRAAGPPIEVDVYREGVRSDSIPLVRRFSADPFELLDRIPGVFRYSMGNLGWPDAVSYQGLSPGAVGLTLDGIPLHDPISGRALFEMLPVDLLAHPGIFTGRHASIAGAAFSTRRLDVRQPHTELRYRVGAPGYQSISATHVQQRGIQLMGTPTVLQVVFRYATNGWEGDYPNSFSDLTQIDGRVGLYTENWALRLTGFLTRRHGGAHGGVVVRGGDFDSIYTTFNATVEEPNATFRTKRSDVRLAYDRVLSRSLKPLSVQFSWVSHVRRYRNVITPESLIHEYTIAAIQEIPAPLADQELSARLITRFDDVRSASVLADSTGLSRSSVEALLESRTGFGDVSVTGDVGFLQSESHLLPQIAVGISTTWLGLDLSSNLSMAGRIPSRLETAGSDRIGVMAQGEVDPERYRKASASVQRRLGAWGLSLEAFAVSTDDALDIWTVAPDSFTVAQASEGFTRYGFMGGLSWRDRADRGLYSEFQATIVTASETGDPLLEAMDESLPSFQSRMRFGMRYLLFQGDLDLDIYLVGRYWSSFRSRVYDPITGVLAVGGDDAGILGNAGTLDARVEAGIRSATLYVGFENALAGASYPGVALVAPYPLPAQAFRFGVFWPIDN